MKIRDVKINESDINGLLGDVVTVCALQLKSPFFDECSPKNVRGNNLLVWDIRKHEQRREKILNILREIKKYRDDIKIIILPEYSLYSGMLDELQKFVNENKIVLVGTYYEDDSQSSYFRKNVGVVILPEREIEKFYKLDRTHYEADFIREDLPEAEAKILRFYWQINEEDKLYFQIFICADFLTQFTKIDQMHGGLILVPMCTPEIEEFKPLAKWCIRPYANSKVERCVILCNSVTLPGQETNLRIIGGTQIIGAYSGTLPFVGEGTEGGLVLTVRAKNMITKPSQLPSEFNIVVENPIYFSLSKKESDEWNIEEKRLPPKKLRYVINPHLFESLGLSTYITFGELKPPHPKGLGILL